MLVIVLLLSICNAQLLRQQPSSPTLPNQPGLQDKNNAFLARASNEEKTYRQLIAQKNRDYINAFNRQSQAIASKMAETGYSISGFAAPQTGFQLGQNQFIFFSQVQFGRKFAALIAPTPETRQLFKDKNQLSDLQAKNCNCDRGVFNQQKQLLNKINANTKKVDQILNSKFAKNQAIDRAINQKAQDVAAFGTRAFTDTVNFVSDSLASFSDPTKTANNIANQAASVDILNPINTLTPLDGLTPGQVDVATSYIPDQPYSAHVQQDPYSSSQPYSAGGQTGTVTTYSSTPTYPAAGTSKSATTAPTAPIKPTIITIMPTTTSDTFGRSTVSLAAPTTTSFNTNPIYMGAPINWTNYTGPVRHQAMCGGCFSIAPVQAFESTMVILLGNPFIQLSVQQIIDCGVPVGRNGCDGGFLEEAYLYIKNYGLLSEIKYPFVSYLTGKSNQCPNNTKGYFKIKDFTSLQKNSCQQLLDVLKTRPVSVGISSLNMQFYLSGIYDNCVPMDPIDHAVVVIGYDPKKGWRIKNSWGMYWGEDGYGWVTLNQKKNCRICQYAMYPRLSIESL